MPGTGTPELIETKLTLELQPVHLAIEDESHRHAGHAGARQGGGHYNVTVVSAVFEGMTSPQRHRLVYRILAAEMHGVIHALSLRTLTPAEWTPPIKAPS